MTWGSNPEPDPPMTFWQALPAVLAFTLFALFTVLTIVATIQRLTNS